MTICLSHEELTDLTGYPSYKGQRRWLDAHGWRYAVARDASPRVARAYFLMRMGVAANGVDEASETAPNWGAIA